MKDRTKIKRNLGFGILGECLSIVIGVLVPRLVLTGYGSEVNGFLSSITQVFSYLSLIGVGIGQATTQALYKPVSENNKGSINSILSATNKVCLKSGGYFFALSLVFAFAYPIVIQSEIPSVTVTLVILVHGFANAIEYFFLMKYFFLLQAEGKNYIQTGLNMAVSILKNIAKIILLLYKVDVVWVQSIAVFVNIIQAVYINTYIKKNYNWIDLSVKPDKEALSQRKNVFIHQIGGLVFNNTDTIILSLYTSLKTVSVYSMYSMLFGLVRTALDTLSNGVTFKIGQLYTSNDDRFHSFFDTFELLYVTLSFALFSIAQFFIEPFLKIYTFGITDISYIDKYLPFLFVTMFMLSSARVPCNIVIFSAGHFKATQNRSLIEAGINLVCSLFFVYLWGIYGVVMGSIIALLYRTNDMIIYANKVIIKRNPWCSYKKLVVNCISYFVVTLVNSHLHVRLDTYQAIFTFLVPYSLGSFILFFGMSMLTHRGSVRMIRELTNNKAT